MRTWLEEEVEGCHTLGEVAQATLGTLRDINPDGTYEIGYVAGPISCDGDEKIPGNIEELHRLRTKTLPEIAGRALLFTSPHIFTSEVYARLGLFQLERGEREIQMRQFWRTIIASGHVDYILVRQGFERSPGTLDEIRTAEEHGVEVRYEQAA
jgi:hypothetical protein